MQCRNPITIAPNGPGTAVTLHCKRCLNCRLNRRDWLVTRILLEHQSNMFGQFWTLTLSDGGLDTFQQKGGKQMLRSFLENLRQRELRRGNPIPVRCFGALEYGTELNRPHYHILLWNHIHHPLEEQPYMKQLPRVRYNIGLWPHGHVDCCPLTTQSARYVAKYVTKFNESDEHDTTTHQPAHTFYPRNPALGSLGLQQHVEKISRTPMKNTVLEPNIEIDGHKWQLDHLRRGHWWWHCRRLGLKTVFDENGMKGYYETVVEAQDQVTWTKQIAAMERELQKNRLYEHTASQYERQEVIKLQRALSYAQRKAVASPWPTNPIATQDVQQAWTPSIQ